MKKTMNISIKREQNNARISSAEREKFGAKLNSKILSPLRRDGYKAGMIMMLIALSTMLLTTACSSEDDLVNNTANTENTINKGYALPVTVNVTREGDATRASFDGSKLNFGDGDKLFVSGYYGDYDKQFAGTLEYDTESGKFSGTIYTQDDTYKTYEDLFGYSDYTIATLLPDGYKDHGYLVIKTNNPDVQYDDYIEASSEYTLATSKADGVAQFSYEQSSSYNNGFALSPNNAILNFTITGLAASTSVNVSLTSIAYTYNITGTVTTDASGNAKFAAGIWYDYNKLQLFSLTVAGNPITLVSSDKEVAKGKIYNIARNAIPGALIGVFSVGANKKVYFSKGNLRYASGTWSFFDNQYDYYTSYSADAWDKFGWSTSANTYGMSTSATSSDYSGDFVDWGATMGTGWFTLSKDEWTYLFNGRSDAANKYGYATVNDVHGIIFLPDAFVDPNKNNGSNAFVGSTTVWGANVYTAENWALMEKNGAVFLPAAGYRDEADVKVAGDDDDEGYYWSSSAKDDEEEPYSYYVYFRSDDLRVDDNTSCFWGHSVRLVRDVAAAAPSYTMAAAATAEDKGKLICTDGHIHAYNTDAECTATRVAMIVYVGNGSDCTNGLAIQLNASPESKNWNDAKTYASGLTAVPGGTWRLPSKADWQNMFVGCAKSGDAGAGNTMDPIAGFKEKIGATGITWQSGGYWSSTDSGSNAWYVNVNLINNKARATFNENDTSILYYVLGCLAF